MKKNISINISGIIFHIEEDGYEILRKYLDSVNRYFASFEDSTEILADIEGRIAEIFLARLNEGKQVITVEDVQSLMATMGSVSDFKAAEEQETPSGEFKQESRKQSAPTDESRKLYRDNKRKILGGVCAGLGHYFNLDPVWPRLLLALLTLGTSGIFLIIYVILWIVLPGTDLEETSVKKMYRDPDKRVLGGVASGVAAFFDADLALIRVLFVIFGIFGFGIVIYIVMWIVLPEAKTITEKMKMQGEPVTLSNIESSVRKSMNEKEPTEESILTRIILLPFRAIGAILRLLGPLLRTIVDVLRVAIGIVISLIGLFLILGFLLAFGVLLGTLSPPNWHLFSDYGIFSPGIPFNAIRNSFPTWLALVAFFTVLIPSLFAVLVGSSIIARRVVFSATVGWSLFVIFFISAGILTVSLPQLIFGFKEKGEYKTEQVVDVGSKTPVLQILETGMDDYDVTTIYLRGHDAKNILLVKRFESQGPSRKVASETPKWWIIRLRNPTASLRLIPISLLRMMHGFAHSGSMWMSSSPTVRPSLSMEACGGLLAPTNCLASPTIMERRPSALRPTVGNASPANKTIQIHNGPCVMSLGLPISMPWTCRASSMFGSNAATVMR